MCIFEIVLIVFEKRDICWGYLSLVGLLGCENLESTVAEQSGTRNTLEIILVEVDGVLVAPKPR